MFPSEGRTDDSPAAEVGASPFAEPYNEYNRLKLNSPGYRLLRGRRV